LHWLPLELAHWPPQLDPQYPVQSEPHETPQELPQLATHPTQFDPGLSLPHPPEHPAHPLHPPVQLLPLHPGGKSCGLDILVTSRIIQILSLCPRAK